MTGRRKRYSADSKAKVALEALHGKHGIHQTRLAAVTQPYEERSEHVRYTVSPCFRPNACNGPSAARDLAWESATPSCRRAVRRRVDRSAEGIDGEGRGSAITPDYRALGNFLREGRLPMAPR